MTLQSTAATAALRFNIGRVLAVAAGLLFRNFATFTLVKWVISIPSYLFSFWFYSFPIDTQRGYLAAHPGFSVLGMLIGVVLGGVSQAALTYGAIQKLDGHEISVGGCLKRGFALAPKAVVAFFLCYLMVLIPMIFLIVPGLIVAAMLWVYMPAIVVENAGIAQSFSRSRFLTKGHRWQIFGFFMLLAALYIVMEIVIFQTVGMGNLLLAMQKPLVVISLSAISLVLLTYLTLMTAAAYYYLRAEKEGAGSDVARVFD